MHSMDYSNLDNVSAVELVKGKRVTVIGSLKSGLDLAVECANANGGYGNGSEIVGRQFEAIWWKILLEKMHSSL
ncbi:hypothetical protein VNO78_03093 [Psophocarpus tetragonolobus]|uniref:Uncharacterized protein n=1 Tax=Psophocarpus tetragonolobus TaxID=3891 RepID=A0AAN9T3R1_PSOTE